MGMMDIRNGGFERGDLLFWEAVNAGVITIDSANEKYGTYCGRCVGTGTGYFGFRHSDFQEVTYGDVINVNLWIKNSISVTTKVYVDEYDIDHNLVNSESVFSGAIGTTHINVNQFHNIPAGIRYIRVRYGLNTTSDTVYTYLDSMMISPVSTDRAKLAYLELSDDSLHNADYDTSATLKDLIGFTKMIADISFDDMTAQVTAFTVTVNEVNPISNELQEVASMTSATGDDEQHRYEMPLAVGKNLYVDVDVTYGATPSYKCEVVIIGVR